MKWGISLLLDLESLRWIPFRRLAADDFFVMNCLVLIIVVLLQTQGADLAGAFGGAGSQTALTTRAATIFRKRRRGAQSCSCLRDGMLCAWSVSERAGRDYNTTKPRPSRDCAGNDSAQTTTPAPGTSAPATQPQHSSLRSSRRRSDATSESSSRHFDSVAAARIAAKLACHLCAAVAELADAPA